MFVQRNLLLLAILTVLDLELANTSQAVLPGEGDRGYVFPPGKYILGGGEEPARGTHVFELKKPFRLRPGQFILSGGIRPTDPIYVDDDIEVSSGDKALFIDDDHVPSTDTRMHLHPTYTGEPIILVLDPKTKLRIQAIDYFANDAILSELYLHRHDGARRRLSERIGKQSNPVLPSIFFRGEFDVDAGFEAPPAIIEVMEMPAIPASLLLKGKEQNK